MESEDRLPTELVWLEDGHLTDVALSALADGEAAILPEEAPAHAERCAACARALGEAALLSLRAGEALREVGAEAVMSAGAAAAVVSAGAAAANADTAAAAVTGPEPGPDAAAKADAAAAALAPVRPFPVLAVAAALGIAALAAVPGLVARGLALRGDLANLRRALFMTLRVGRSVVESDALAARGWMLAVPWVSAALLLLIGLSVARAARGQVSAEGGMR